MTAIARPDEARAQEVKAPDTMPTGTPATGDRPCLRRAARGDTEAVGALFHSHSDRIARQLTALLGPDAPIDDLVQDTFILALRNYADFRRRSALSTWLHGIAVNVARNHRAKRARRARIDAALPAAPDRDAATPEREVASRRALARLHAALDELPEGEREAFVLRVIECVPIKEAAAVLNVSPSTVSERARRAEDKLRRLVEHGTETK